MKSSTTGIRRLMVRQYGFSLEEAESKKRSGELPDDYEASVSRPFVESMVQEIGRALQFFFTRTQHKKVDYVMLAGRSAAVPGLTAAVTQHITFACTFVNTFDGMKIGEGVRLKKMTREA